MHDDKDSSCAGDRWNAGAIDGYRGTKPRSDDADYLKGYRDGQRDAQVKVVMPARPEGYYHQPIGTFD